MTPKQIAALAIHIVCKNFGIAPCELIGPCRKFETRVWPRWIVVRLMSKQELTNTVIANALGMHRSNITNGILGARLEMEQSEKRLLQFNRIQAEFVEVINKVK